MNRQQRAKRAVLERTLASLDAVERRAIADLRGAGYRFQTIEKARQHLAALRTLDRIEDMDDLAEAFADRMRKDTK